MIGHHGNSYSTAMTHETHKQVGDGRGDILALAFYLSYDDYILNPIQTDGLSDSLFSFNGS